MATCVRVCVWRLVSGLWCLDMVLWCVLYGKGGAMSGVWCLVYDDGGHHGDYGVGNGDGDFDNEGHSKTEGSDA